MTRILSLFDCYPSSRRGVWLLVAMFGVGILLGVAATMIMTSLGGAQFASTYGMLISYPLQFIPAMIYASAMSRAASVALPGTFCRKGDGLSVDRRGSLSMPWWTVCIMAVVSTIACAVVVEPLAALLPPVPEYLEQALRAIADGPLWVALLSVAVFAPFFEEWLCRGMVMRSILMRNGGGNSAVSGPATSKGVFRAIVLSAIFFAVIHMNPWQAVPAFLMGSLFGYVYYKTGSLRLTMLMHCANNTVSIALIKSPACREYDYLWEMMDFGGNSLPYCATFAAAFMLLAASIFIFSKIVKR